MAFDASAYGPAVQEILKLDGAGERLMPLTQGESFSEAARDAIRSAGVCGLFMGSRAPEAALAGLYLYFSCWDDAHETAQAIPTPEGSYWHAILHRQEPDDWNSGYWFRQLGRHAIFPKLAECASDFYEKPLTQWDPIRFVELCANARQQPGSELERRALAVQRIEWQLLFDYCAAKSGAV
jgi:hypothetical protein